MIHIISIRRYLSKFYKKFGEDRLDEISVSCALDNVTGEFFLRLTDLIFFDFNCILLTIIIKKLIIIL